MARPERPCPTGTPRVPDVGLPSDRPAIESGVGAGLQTGPRWHGLKGRALPVCRYDLCFRIWVVLRSGISERRLPVGAEARGAHGTHFRVWAPHHGQVAVSLEDERGASLAEVPLQPEP